MMRLMAMPEGARREGRREQAAPASGPGVVQVGVKCSGEVEVQLVLVAADRGWDGVVVFALVCVDNHGSVLVRPFHLLLHRALLCRAPAIASICIHVHQSLEKNRIPFLVGCIFIVKSYIQVS